MDFNDQTEFAKNVTHCRPHLSTDKRKIYEDSTRSGQVLSEMHRFYQDERLCDVNLIVDEEQFACHRLVLAASSLYFERMFSNGMSEARAKDIRLRNLSPCALKHLIEFAYSSKLCVQKDTVLEIFEAADMLNFPAARMFCQDFLMDQIDINNCLSFITYADRFSCEPLYERAKSCAAANFQLICSTAEFLELPKNHLEELLRDDNIEMEYEEHIYEALKKWVLHDDSRLVNFADLFKCIRLNFVSRWYLIEVISKDELIAQSAECSNIIQSA
ncbi:hypothetical protein CAPTEDRAFT_93209, partial [Capitella teleta]|uniref:BTB domain-containing protein n=1 Tax=Capitella teleta TaxID=283909 RepID=X2BBW5_CAPTE